LIKEVGVWSARDGKNFGNKGESQEDLSWEELGGRMIGGVLVVYEGNLQEADLFSLPFSQRGGRKVREEIRSTGGNPGRRTPAEGPANDSPRKRERSRTSGLSSSKGGRETRDSLRTRDVE